MNDLKEIALAINKVSLAVKGVEKSMVVGSGTFSYKGVSDKLVKETLGKSMKQNGLSLLPIGIQPKTTIERWVENDYNGKAKQKQSIFTEVVTKYLLLHTSGQSIELSGLGHGVDPMDKAAGKATTYAMKYAMLYAFMIPTGDIDDTDNEHSENKEVPKTLPELTPDHPRFEGAKKSISEGNINIDAVLKNYSMSEETKSKLLGNE